MKHRRGRYCLLPAGSKKMTMTIKDYLNMKHSERAKIILSLVESGCPFEAILEGNTLVVTFSGGY
jgi:hypothetical protein